MATAVATRPLSLLLDREAPPSGAAASATVEAPPAPSPTRTARADEIDISGGE